MVDRSPGRLGLSVRADSPDTCSRKSSSPLRISSAFKCRVTLCATAAPAELASGSGACAGATAVPAGAGVRYSVAALQEFWPHLCLTHAGAANLRGDVALPGPPTNALRDQLSLLPDNVRMETPFKSHASWRQTDQPLGSSAYIRQLTWVLAPC